MSRGNIDRICSIHEKKFPEEVFKIMFPGFPFILMDLQLKSTQADDRLRCYHSEKRISLKGTTMTNDDIRRLISEKLASGTLMDNLPKEGETTTLSLGSDPSARRLKIVRLYRHGNKLRVKKPSAFRLQSK